MGRRPPLRVFVGVGARQRGHGVAQDGVGVVKHLLHVHGAVGPPAHVVACRERETYKTSFIDGNETPLKVAKTQEFQNNFFQKAKKEK